MTTHSVPSLDTPPRGDCTAAAEILAVESLSPRDKVRLFVEEQQRQSREDTRAGPLPLAVPGAAEGDATVRANPTSATVAEEAEGKSSKKAQSAASGRKRKELGEGMAKDRKRGSNSNKRQKTEAGADDPALLLFRHSQKALRKEAQHVSMREVLSRTLSAPVGGSSDASNPFSPTGCSQSSAWSPSIATTLTNQFLSNVQRQKKQTFERLIQKEITNSQLSFSHLADDAGSEESVPELIIGDEAAVMIPPGIDGNSNDIISVDKETHLPRSGQSAPQALEEHDEEAEQAQSEALRRKHELWRARQRHLREQIQAVSEETHVKRSGDTVTSAHAAMAATTVSTRAPPAAGDAEGPLEVVTITQRMSIQRTQSSTFGISANHIDMLRRVNSFENTSSQRVALFEARNSKQGVNKNESLP